MTTKIEWTDEVWNPVTGCTKVSQGCKNCYAERIAERFWADRRFTDVICHEDRLDIPLHWKKPRRVFVNSMSDLFHDDVPADFILKVWTTMARTPQHTYQILTKRPYRMDIIVNEWLPGAFALANMVLLKSPLPNVWLGVSVEDQETADKRIPLLLQVSASKHFVSYEPALGPITMQGYDGTYARYYLHHEMGGTLDWIIAGGESGPGARPANPDWFRSVRDQCQAAGVPFFFKQWGEWITRKQWIASARDLGDVPNRAYINAKPFGDDQVYKVGKKAAGRVLDTLEWNQYPEATA